MRLMTLKCVLGTGGPLIGGALGGAAGGATVGMYLLPGTVVSVDSVNMVSWGFVLGSVSSAAVGVATFCTGLIRWP